MAAGMRGEVREQGSRKAPRNRQKQTLKKEQ